MWVVALLHQLSIELVNDGVTPMTMTSLLFRTAAASALAVGVAVMLVAPSHAKDPITVGGFV